MNNDGNRPDEERPGNLRRIPGGPPHHAGGPGAHSGPRPEFNRGHGQGPGSGRGGFGGHGGSAGPGGQGSSAGRPGGGGGGPGHAGKGRGAPPETTGAETNYLVKNMQAKTPMVVRLIDNQELHGWIEYYDRHVIKLNRRQPPHLFIRKEKIKYIYKDEGRGASPHRDKP
jgi:hypothetical protein